MTIIAANQLRGLTADMPMLNADGSVITVGDDDEIRVIIGRLSELGGTAAVPTGAKLIVASDAPTANGSTFTKDGGQAAGSHRLRLDAQDLTFQHGTYTLIFDFFDNADAADWKTVDRQVFILGETT